MPLLILLAPPVYISKVIKEELDLSYDFLEVRPFYGSLIGFTGGILGLIVGCLCLVIVLPIAEAY